MVISEPFLEFQAVWIYGQVENTSGAFLPIASIGGQGNRILGRGLG